jgi:hypothetical protein
VELEFYPDHIVYLALVSGADCYFLHRIYKGVADKTAKNGYRADLREEAVARVSAVRRSQLPKKDAPAKKLRGIRARKAAEESE